MGDLVLDSLEIRGFRGFRHLQIEHLGRVNLIVGKNNVGKSSLLEALQLYAKRADPTLIFELLRSRDEGTYRPRQIRNVEGKNLLSYLKYLFYGRREVRTPVEPILIGPIGSADKRLSINAGWFVRQLGDDGVSKMHLLRPDEYDTADNPISRFIIRFGTQGKFFPLDSTPISNLDFFDFLNSVFIASNGLDKTILGGFWDRIVLTDLEEDVIAALRIIAPGVERLSIAGGDPNARERLRALVPILRVSGIEEPIPLRSLGDGMQRILGIALALVNAKDGILLIDEFENGLHYSIQADLWQLIFKLAHRLNVQVFATTHSWDCIEAFQEAAQEDDQEGVLIRLQSRQGEISATIYNEEELKIATREQIEVR